MGNIKSIKLGDTDYKVVDLKSEISYDNYFA